MRYLLGIDDTDDKTSRGTGYRARQLGAALQEGGLAEFRAATRHQLLVDPRIRYTSRNSSICLVLDIPGRDVAPVGEYVAAELTSSSAPGSHAGLAMAPHVAVSDSIQAFGRAAKREFLSSDATESLSDHTELVFERIAGEGNGVIGALAAIGLHSSGEDGRFIWLPKLRDLVGTYAVGELEKLLGVGIESPSGTTPPPAEKIKASNWMRPVLRQGCAILLAEEEMVGGEIRWRLTDKPIVKALSD